MSKRTSLAIISTLPAIAACALLGATQAGAVTCSVNAAECIPYVVTFLQVGPNLVATGEGEFDLSGLTLTGTNVSVAGGPAIRASTAGLRFATPGTVDTYSGGTGPTNIGTGALFDATSSTGPTVTFGATSTGVAQPNVTAGYTSGTPLESEIVWDNATLASLGITPNEVFRWTWGPAADQSFTINTELPLPAALPLFATGLGALGLLGWRRKRKATAAF